MSNGLSLAVCFLLLPAGAPGNVITSLLRAGYRRTRRYERPARGIFRFGRQVSSTELLSLAIYCSKRAVFTLSGNTVARQ